MQSFALGGGESDVTMGVTVAMSLAQVKANLTSVLLFSQRLRLGGYTEKLSLPLFLSPSSFLHVSFVSFPSVFSSQLPSFFTLILGMFSLLSILTGRPSLILFSRSR